MLSDLVERRGADLETGVFLGAARQIGRRLVAGAMWHEDRCSWMGDDMAFSGGEWRVVHRSVDGWQYGGTSGIARFLAHLSFVVEDESYRPTVLASVRHALARADRELSLSLWSGALGVACGAVEIGRLLNDAELVDRGLGLGNRIAANSLDSSSHQIEQDVIAGHAGTCMALAYLYRRGGGRHVVDACHAAARRLVRNARRLACGWSWTMTEGHDTTPHLCGAAHGASGVAAGLLEAYDVSGDEAFLEAAFEGMRYEKSWFNRTLSNWPDLRETATRPPANPSYPDFWCHGAAGIGIVRLRAYALTKHLTPLAEASAAIQAVRPTLERACNSRWSSLPANWNLSVCHGLGSIAELLLYAHEVLGTKHYLTAARKLGRAALDDLLKQNRDWPCGVNGGGETPGVMLGLSGIGLWYLRLGCPSRVPSATVWI